MNTLIQTACDLLGDGQTLVLATIVSHRGSTPRTSGSKMIVTADGRGIGTIGGGLLEAGAMSRAVELIGSGASALMPVDLSVDTMASMDMICGGEAEVLLDCVSPTPENRAFFERWRELLQTGARGCLITRVRPTDGGVVRVEHALADARGNVDEAFPLSASELDSVAAATASPEIRFLEVDGGFLLLEPVMRVCRAHLFGAGHVARPTAHLAAMVGFRVSVADDRQEFANRQRFPEAHEIRVLDGFAHCLAGADLDHDDFVVILTRGHLHDQTVLAQALRTGAGYIGMIGSRRKRATIFEALLGEGFTRTDLDRVHSPIGIAIDAETPEEIAVSIVAELIAARAGMRS